MKLLIDNSNLLAGGGIQVATSFLNDLNRLDLHNEYHVVQSFNSSSAINKKQFKKNFYFYDLDSNSSNCLYTRIKKIRRLENLIKPEVIFTVFGPSYHKSKFPKVVGFAIPYIIYRDSPFFSKISFFERIKYQFLIFIKKRSFIFNSDILIFETESAKSNFSKYIKNSSNLYTVTNTLNEVFFNNKKWETFTLENTSNFNILYLSANYLHKNINIIPDVIDILINKYNFLSFKFLLSVERREMDFLAKYDKNIEYLGVVPLNKIPSLYSQSHIAFIPTLLEVFSATYLEAMHMKIPIVASNMPFSRDICGKAALYCEPTNAESYADAIYELYSDSERRKELVREGILNSKRFGSSMNRTEKYLKIVDLACLLNKTK